MTRLPFGRGPGKVLGSVLVGMLLASAAFAQNFGGPPPPDGGPPFGPPPGGPPPVSLSMLPISVLDTSLKLTTSQDAKITKIQQQFRPRWGGGPPPDARGGRPGRRPDTQADTQIRAVLNPVQKKALPALLAKIDALGAAGIPPPVYGDLKLTANQQKQLVALGQKAKKNQMQAMPQGRPPDSFGPGQDPMRQTHEQAMAILTSAQRTVVERFQESHRGPGGPGGNPGMPGGQGRRGHDGGGYGPPPPGDWGPPPRGGGPPPDRNGPG